MFSPFKWHFLDVLILQANNPITSNLPLNSSHNMDTISPKFGGSHLYWLNFSDLLFKLFQHPIFPFIEISFFYPPPPQYGQAPPPQQGYGQPPPQQGYGQAPPPQHYQQPYQQPQYGQQVY